MTQRGGRDILAAVLVVDITTWVGEEPLEPRTWAQKRRAVRMGYAWRKKGTSGTDGEKRCPTQEGPELGVSVGWWRRNVWGSCQEARTELRGLGKAPFRDPPAWTCLDLSHQGLWDSQRDEQLGNEVNK